MGVDAIRAHYGGLPRMRRIRYRLHICSPTMTAVPILQPPSALDLVLISDSDSSKTRANKGHFSSPLL